MTGALLPKDAYVEGGDTGAEVGRADYQEVLGATNNNAEFHSFENLNTQIHACRIAKNKFWVFP